MGDNDLSVGGGIAVTNGELMAELRAIAERRGRALKALRKIDGLLGVVGVREAAGATEFRLATSLAGVDAQAWREARALLRLPPGSGAPWIAEFTVAAALTMARDAATGGMARIARLALSLVGLKEFALELHVRGRGIESETVRLLLDQLAALLGPEELAGRAGRVLREALTNGPFQGLDRRAVACGPFMVVVGDQGTEIVLQVDQVGALNAILSGERGRELMQRWGMR